MDDRVSFREVSHRESVEATQLRLPRIMFCRPMTKSATPIRTAGVNR